MKDLYLVRRDVLDRIHQNPNAVPVVYPDELGKVLQQADLSAVARESAARLGLAELSQSAQSGLAGLDKALFIAEHIKGHRDLIGFLDRRGYDNASGDSYAAWAILWDGMKNWDNRKWDWAEVATASVLVSLCCPEVEQREPVIVGHGSTAH